MLESAHQTKVQKYLQKEGFKTVNLISTNRPGIPDLLILIGNWRHFWIEMKKPKGSVTPALQKFMQKDLQRFWDISMICKWFDDFVKQYNEIKHKFWK